jgi:16S rRNA (cytosine(1402)-N(4))-methyltransferase
MTGVGLTERGPVRHVPVLLEEVLEAVDARPGALIVDGTFGAGGYAKKALEQGARVIGIDRDPDAIRDGAALVAGSGGKLTLFHRRFSKLEEALSGEMADAVMLDIGVSSMQLDEAERGFSFMRDGPLDMRMARKGASAADVVNFTKTAELIRIFGILGEEKNAGRIARMIEKRRLSQRFETTKDLADAIQNLDAGVSGAAHPCERRAGRTGAGAGRFGKGFERGRAACRRDLPFAGRPDRQEIFRRPHRRIARLAASAGDGNDRAVVHADEERRG